MKKLIGIDLFCGAGGFSLGLSRNNIEIVLANEIEKDFAKTFELNHPKTKMLNEDIHNIDFKKELIGNSFVINNPKASSSCGCGLSFSV